MSASGSRSGLGLISFASSNYKTIGGLIAALFMGFWLNVARQGINATTAIFNVFIKPVAQLATDSAGLVNSIVGGAGDIIDQGVRTSVLSIAPGATWAIGPLTAAASIAVVGVMLYVLGRVLALGVTSDAIPFTFTDFPLIGVDETEEGEE